MTDKEWLCGSYIYCGFTTKQAPLFCTENIRGHAHAFCKRQGLIHPVTRCSDYMNAERQWANCGRKKLAGKMTHKGLIEE